MTRVWSSGSRASTTRPAPSAWRELDEVFGSGSGAIIDLSDAEFIDSGILGVLVHAHRVAETSAQVRLVVIVPPDSPAAKLFDLVGARDFIPTFPSLGDAVAS